MIGPIDLVLLGFLFFLLLSAFFIKEGILWGLYRLIEKVEKWRGKW